MRIKAGNSKAKLSVIILFILIFMGVTNIDVFGFLGFATTESWKEEVQLSDGRIIIVEREIINERGGGELLSNRSGTKPKEYYMRFVHPDESGKTIEWRSTKKSGTWPEIPLILDMESGEPFIFTIVGISAHRCEMYCKYLYRNGAWHEEALPEKFEPRIRNLLVRGKVDVPKFVDLETKRKINESKHSRKPVRQVGPNREICG